MSDTLCKQWELVPDAMRTNGLWQEVQNVLACRSLCARRILFGKYFRFCTHELWQGQRWYCLYAHLSDYGLCIDITSENIKRQKAQARSQYKSYKCFQFVWLLLMSIQSIYEYKQILLSVVPVVWVWSSWRLLPMQMCQSMSLHPLLFENWKFGGLGRCVNLMKSTCRNIYIDCGRSRSRLCMSLENRLIIRPIGFLSKKIIRALITLVNIFWCIDLDTIMHKT